jgi:hypothetical protein
VREAVIILGPVPAWSEEAIALVRQKFPQLQIARCNEKASLRAEVEKHDVTMVICQGETDADLSESFLFLKTIHEYLERGTVVFGIYTNRISNPNLQAFEKRKLIRRFSPWSTTRAIPLHLETALLDLKRAFARHQKTKPTEGRKETSAVVDLAPNDIILISDQEEDLLLCTAVAKKLGCGFHLFTQISQDLQKLLNHYPDAVVFWDVEHESASVLPILLKSAKSHPIFAISDQPAPPRDISIHNLTRKNDLASQIIYSHLVENVLSECPMSLNGFFTAGSRKNIQLTSSDHRGPALVAMRKFLSSEGLSSRLGNLVEQACDELLLNAIYHAPVDKKGVHYQAAKDKNFVYPFRKVEEVTVSLMSNEHYFGISVTDSFGSLYLKQVLDYLTQEQKPNEPHLGLFKIIDSGFSLLLNVIPGQLTEAMLFFPKAASHKEFKSGFRFLSLRSGKAT